MKTFSSLIFISLNLISCAQSIALAPISISTLPVSFTTVSQSHPNWIQATASNPINITGSDEATLVQPTKKDSGSTGFLLDSGSVDIGIYVQYPYFVDSNFNNGQNTPFSCTYSEEIMTAIDFLAVPDVVFRIIFGMATISDGNAGANSSFFCDEFPPYYAFLTTHTVTPKTITLQIPISATQVSLGKFIYEGYATLCTVSMSLSGSTTGAKASGNTVSVYATLINNVSAVSKITNNP